MKKFLLVLATAALSLIMFVCGCMPAAGRDGRDGKDGQDVSIYDVYEAAKKIEGKEDLTFDEFLREYLNFTDSHVDVRAAVNRSLHSGVTILSRFAYTSRSGGTHLLPGASYTYYSVYTGSGAIIWLDKAAGDAYVVTNCHVVYSDTSKSVFCDDVRLYLYGQDESGINFTVNQKEIYGNDSYEITNDENFRISAEIVGASVTYDIALLKVSGSEVLKRSDAMAASFSHNENVSVGEEVYAIGNASGEGMSATYGIISKDSENIELSLSDKENILKDDYTSYRVMRTTAPVNHGNSGGALYNTYGEIVGIINAKDEGEDIDNMGYALPGNSVRRLLKLMYDNYVSNGYKMRSGGGILKAFLNVETSVTDSYARYNNQTGLSEITEHVIIHRVIGNPALGKFNENDYIKSVKILSSDGAVKESIANITRRFQLPELLFLVEKGDTVVVTVERGGTQTEVSIEFNSDSDFKFFE